MTKQYLDKSGLTYFWGKVKYYVDNNAGAIAYDSLPVGTIVEWTTNTVPDNYLICDGQAVSKNVYHDLYAVIGDTYGASGNTFNLPNLKGKVPVGRDTSQTEFDTLGETGGSKYLQEHKHTYGGSSGGEYIGAVSTGWTASTTGGTGKVSNDTATYTGGVLTGTGGVSVGNSGNLQPYLIVNYIIKAHPSVVNTSEVVNEHSTSTTDTYSCNYINTVAGFNHTAINNYSASTANQILSHDTTGNLEWITVTNGNGVSY